MLYGSGIYIVSENDMPDFLNEVKKEYKDIEWFLPESYIYNHFNKYNTHKLVFLGNGERPKSYNKHKVKQISWQNPKNYESAIDSAKYMTKKGCKYSNNNWLVYKKMNDTESIYNLLVSSYDKNFAFEALLEKFREIGAEVLDAIELKKNFVDGIDYNKVRIYIKPREKESKDMKNEIKNKLVEEIKKAQTYAEEVFNSYFD